MERQWAEARVLEIVSRVLAGRRVEDDRVELKAIWPQAGAKTARQIAGHANATGGGSVLWIIGVDEDGHRLTGSDGPDVAEWWPPVRRWFDEQAPAMSCLVVPVGDGKQVTALEFDVSRAPYVVAVPDGGRVQREVPWRQNNSTESAHRHQLLAAVVEQAAIPTFALIDGDVQLFTHKDYDGEEPRVRVACDVFVSAVGSAILPEHLQVWSLEGTNFSGIRDLSAKVRGPARLSGFGPSWERDPLSSIEVVEHSGLDISSSAPIHVFIEKTVSEEQAAAIEGLDQIQLRATFGIDRSRHIARLSEMFLRDGGSPSVRHSRARAVFQKGS